MTQPQALPTLPSALILLALSDLRKCEAQPQRFIIDMGEWHNPADGLCRVCLAGAVLAQTIQVPDDQTTIPTWSSSNPIENALFALNNFRLGWIDDGLDNLGFSLPDDMDYICNIPEYSEDPEAFHQALTTLAQTLATYGL